MLLIDFFSSLVFLSLFSIFFLFLLLCKGIFRWLASFLKTYFFVFKESILQYLKKNQVQIMVFNKRPFVKFLGCHFERAHHKSLLNFVASFSWSMSQEKCAEFFALAASAGERGGILALLRVRDGGIYFQLIVFFFTQEIFLTQLNT